MLRFAVIPNVSKAACSFVHRYRSKLSQHCAVVPNLGRSQSLLDVTASASIHLSLSGELPLYSEASVQSLISSIRDSSCADVTKLLLSPRFAGKSLLEDASLPALMDVVNNLLEKFGMEEDEALLERLRTCHFCGDLLTTIALKAGDVTGVEADSIMPSLELAVLVRQTFQPSIVAALIEKLHERIARGISLQELIVFLQAYSLTSTDFQKYTNTFLSMSSDHVAANLSEEEFTLLIKVLAGLSQKSVKFWWLAFYALQERGQVISMAEHLLHPSLRSSQINVLQRALENSYMELDLCVLLAFTEQLVKHLPFKQHRHHLIQRLFRLMINRPLPVESFSAFLGCFQSDILRMSRKLSYEINRPAFMDYLELTVKLMEYLLLSAVDKRNVLCSQMLHELAVTSKQCTESFLWTPIISEPCQKLLVKIFCSVQDELCLLSLCDIFLFVTSVLSLNYIDDGTYAVRKAIVHTVEECSWCDQDIKLHLNRILQMLRPLSRFLIRDVDLLRATSNLLQAHASVLDAVAIDFIAPCYANLDFTDQGLMSTMVRRLKECNQAYPTTFLWSLAILGLELPTGFQLKVKVDNLSRKKIFQLVQLLLLAKDWSCLDKPSREDLFRQNNILKKNYFMPYRDAAMHGGLGQSLPGNCLYVGVALDEEYLTVAALYNQERCEFVPWPSGVFPEDICQENLSLLPGVPVGLVPATSIYMRGKGASMTAFARASEKLLKQRGWSVAFVPVRRSSCVSGTKFANKCFRAMVKAATKTV